MKKNASLMTAAIATGAVALITAALAAPAAFADTDGIPAPAPCPSVNYELPTVPTAESLAKAGLSIEGLTVTEGAGSYTISADSVSLDHDATEATLSIGDNRDHNGGVNYVDWLDVTAANNGAPFLVTIPVDPGDYTVTISAGSTDTDGTPLLTDLNETAVSVPAR